MTIAHRPALDATGLVPFTTSASSGTHLLKPVPHLDTLALDLLLVLCSVKAVAAIALRVLLMAVVPRQVTLAVEIQVMHSARVKVHEGWQALQAMVWSSAD